MICRAPTPSGRLNAFQQVMLQWSALHPYNAIHTYRLSGPLCLHSLRQAIQEAFDHNGLGWAELDADGVSYRYEADMDSCLPEIELVGGEGTPEERLVAHLAMELNRPFERPRCRPFRFCVVDAGPTSHFVSLVYDHWTADSVAARLVMRHVLGRYLDLDIPENEQPLDLYPGTYREVFSNRLQGHRLAGPMFRSIQTWMRNRSAWRVAYASAHQMEVGYSLYHTSSGTVRQVRQFARNHEVAVNDVFLAALGRAMAPHLPKRCSHRTMTLGTIVDTRQDAVEDLGESMGTFLGYYLVRVASDPNVGLDEVARRIAEVTRKTKEQRSYLDAALNFRVVSKIWPHLKPGSRPNFARRALPLSAGISNVHLRGTWIEQQGAGRILDFSRAVSNGPTLPLVISPTTIRDQMNISVSYRVTGFSQSRVDKIMGSFVEQLETLDGTESCKPARVSSRATCAA